MKGKLTSILSLILLTIIVSALMYILFEKIKRKSSRANCITNELVQNKLRFEVGNVIKHLSFYKKSLNIWKTDLKWFSDNVSPSIENYKTSTTVGLEVISLLPLVDRMKKYLDKIQYVLNIGKDVTEELAFIENIEGDIFSIERLYIDFEKQNDNKILYNISEKLYTDFYSKLDEMNTRLNKLRSLLNESNEIITGINETTEYLEEKGQSITGNFKNYFGMKEEKDTTIVNTEENILFKIQRKNEALCIQADSMTVLSGKDKISILAIKIYSELSNYYGGH